MLLEMKEDSDGENNQAAADDGKERQSQPERKALSILCVSFHHSEFTTSCRAGAQIDSLDC
jgi:hypothetical protein